MNTETLLREALSGRADALGVPQEDPWPRFARRERTHRRGRRIRLAAAAAVLAAAVGVQAGAVPLPGWAPTIVVSGQSALTEGPTRGSLAGDRAWLEGMRATIKDVEDPGEVWRIADRSKIKFVYAADVPGYRMVLALVPLRFGFLTDQALIWYEGNPGAAPDQMNEAGRVDGGKTVVSHMRGSTDGDGVLVVVAPRGSTIAVSVGSEYTAAGKVQHNRPQLWADGGGVAESRLPKAPFDPGVTVTVTEGDRTIFAGPSGGSWSGNSGVPNDQEPTGAMLDRALGGRAFDRETLRRWLSHALHDACLTASGTTAEVRWTGTVHGQPAALFTIRPGGGGVLAYALHGGAESYRQDLRLLLPAAGAARRPIAWRMRAEGKDDRTDQVIVVVPPGTRSATLTVAGAAPVALAPDASGAAVAAVPPDAAATVTVQPADGSAPSSTPVPLFETNLGGLPGDTPLTRVVE